MQYLRYNCARKQKLENAVELLEETIDCLDDVFPASGGISITIQHG